MRTNTNGQGQSGDAGVLQPGRAEPECVTLGVKAGFEPSKKPPVRIYLGTEAAQQRAERVFLWSIERVRDLTRIYEIYIMRELVGFDRGGWTTGFTNYRFAIPGFAHGSGRAIWNDVDQIYLSDPAELFDADMGDCAVLALGPDSHMDTAVMLIDCERMAKVWTLDAARTQHKKKLIERARSIAGLRGDLPRQWHARDTKDYVPGETKCLHYTTLHTQPWQPVPGRFVYQPHPLGDLWHDLERECEAAGFRHFNRNNPTRRFEEIRAGRDQDPKEGAVRDHADGRKSFGGDERLGRLIERSKSERIHGYDPFLPARNKVWDGIVCESVLELVPEDDVPWVVDEMFRAASKFVYAVVEVESESPVINDRAYTSLATDPERWRQYFESASRRRPEVHWQLVVDRKDAGIERFWGGRFLGDLAPRVCVLADDSSADADAAVALAEELAWPYRMNPAMSALTVDEPPDLVIAADDEAMKKLRSLRSRSDAPMRIVRLGASAPDEDVDLLIAPVSNGVFPDPRLFEVATRLSGVRRRVSDTVDDSRRTLLESSSSPRTVAIIDGPAVGPALTIDAIRKLGGEIAAVGDSAGGSLFVVVSGKIPETCWNELRALLPGGASIVRTTSVNCDETYSAHLAIADQFVAIGDSERTVADMCAMQKPVILCELPSVATGLRERFRSAVLAMAKAPRSNDRGTVRPQQGLERWFSNLIAKGYVRPPHDVDRMKRILVESGAASVYSPSPGGRRFSPVQELQRAADRVRVLVGAVER